MARSARTSDYPPRLRWLIAGTLALALPSVVGAARAIVLDPPSAGAVLGISVFLGLALLADLKPIPLDAEGRSSVSLAFVFILATVILFGWQFGIAIAAVSVLVPQLLERKPLGRSAFNSAVYTLATLAAALPIVGLGVSAEGGAMTTALFAFLGGAAFTVVNIVFVSTAVALYQRIPLGPLLAEDFKQGAPPFVTMACLAALATALWRIDPSLLVLMAGPLFAVTLYQRSSLASRIATKHAHTDSLTGLGNHRAYELRLAAAIERARAAETHVSLCLVDVDDFKAINDGYGHPVGDRVMVEVAEHLSTGDSCAFRFGGDEFALILECDESAAYQLVEGLHERISAARFAHGDAVTISVGLGSSPKHATTAEELQTVADGALYWAKQHGKNRSCVYTPSIVRVYTAVELELRAERQARLRAARNLAKVVDAKDAYTGSHSESVARLVEALARRLGLKDEMVDQLRLAGLLHDLGKIALPDEILQKPGPLTPHELQRVRAHAELGYSLLDGLDIRPVDIWIRHSHEHWDGSGYPHGLRGDDIPLGSRIILVADAFDAITSERSYRPAASVRDAIHELRAGAGKQFDATIVSALEAHVARPRSRRELEPLAIAAAAT